MEASLGPMLNSKQVFLSSPDAVKLRITEDTSLTTPIAADMPELSVPDPAVGAGVVRKVVRRQARQAQGRTGGRDSRVQPALHQSRGRGGSHQRARVRSGRTGSAEHRAFCKSLEAGGIKLDVAYRKATNMALAICVLTDPWGTYIELSDGLAAVQ